MTAKPALDALLAGFPLITVLPIQWGDQDAFGHVNSTVFFRWFESGRIDYLRRIHLLEMRESEGIGPILASINCDFRNQVTFPDTMHIASRVTRIGRSSFGMDHKVVSERQAAIVGEGTSTLVVFDYRANKSHPVPAAVRHAIEAIEGHTFG